MSFEARLNGGQVAIQTRSGNLDQPQKNWSAWSAPITTPKGGRIASPAARFVQWKATLTADGAGHSPELESVDVAYLPKNVEPRIDEIEITPPNYKFPGAVLRWCRSSAPPQTLNLPPLGKRSPRSSLLRLDIRQHARHAVRQGISSARAGWQPIPTAIPWSTRWRSAARMRPSGSRSRRRLPRSTISWDSTAFPDGEYRLRITASRCTEQSARRGADCEAW